MTNLLTLFSYKYKKYKGDFQHDYFYGNETTVYHSCKYLPSVKTVQVITHIYTSVEMLWLKIPLYNMNLVHHDEINLEKKDNVKLYNQHSTWWCPSITVYHMCKMDEKCAIVKFNSAFKTLKEFVWNKNHLETASSWPRGCSYSHASTHSKVISFSFPYLCSTRSTFTTFNPNMEK